MGFAQIRRQTSTSGVIRLSNFCTIGMEPWTGGTPRTAKTTSLYRRELKKDSSPTTSTYAKSTYYDIYYLNIDIVFFINIYYIFSRHGLFRV